MQRYLLKTVVLIAAFMLPLSNIYAAENKVITFGVVPQQSASKMAKLWNPILEYLQKETGYKFRFKTAKNIPTFEERIVAGKYDIAYMNPYHYTVFHQEPGYNAIAHAKDKRIHGIIVVHKDSSYKTLADLQGKKLSFPSPAAFAATLLTEAQLAKENIKYSKKYVSSHDSVYRNVAAKRFAAGGGVIRTMKNMEDKISSQLRILWKSNGYTPHAIATHPDMDKAVAKKIQDALAGMHKNEQGLKLVKSIKLKGFVKADNNKWDDVRRMNIKFLNKFLK